MNLCSAAGDETTDRVALRALVDSYAIAVDARDVERFTALFTDDATLAVHDADDRLRREFAGVGEIAAIPRALERYERTLHLVSTQVVDLVGSDRALGTTLCEAHHLSSGTTGSVDRVMAIHYHDTYARRPHGWRFARREVHVQWEDQRPMHR